MTMTREQVAALLDGTTPGPWNVSGLTIQNDFMIYAGNMYGVGEAWNLNGRPENEANAKIMAAAPDLARSLLAAMDRLADAELAEARAKIDQMTAAWGKDALEVEELRAQVEVLERERDDALAFLDNAVSDAPEPLRALGSWLAGVLDEDAWPTAERFLNAAVKSCAALAAAKPIPNVSAGWPLEEGDGSIVVGKVKEGKGGA